MSLALASVFLFAQQLQATCAPSGNTVEADIAVVGVRQFIQLGNRRDFEGAASWVVPGAVAETSDGDTVLVMDAINRTREEGDIGEEPTFVLDTMAAPGAVAVKVSKDGNVGIAVFELDGSCITRIKSFEK
jgi:hypothetical protein